MGGIEHLGAGHLTDPFHLLVLKRQNQRTRGSKTKERLKKGRSKKGGEMGDNDKRIRKLKWKNRKKTTERL